MSSMTAPSGRASANVREALSLPAGAGAPADTSGNPNPYPGLAAYKPEAHHLFFGRDEDVARASERLARTRLLSVVGRSGTGKSSLVAAGIVPRLREMLGDIAYRRCEPQADPCRQLAEALCRELPRSEREQQRIDELRRAVNGIVDIGAPNSSEERLASAIEHFFDQPGERLVLLIDQFEGLFTHAPAASGRRFRDLLDALLRVDRLYLVLTLRSEFTARLMEWLGEELFRESLMVLEPITGREQLHAIITGPAEAYGVPVQKELLARLVMAASVSSGALPLIALSLEKLFEQRDPERGLTLEAYQQMGGLESIVESAAASIERLIVSEPELELACVRLFAELATVVDELPTRRTVEIAPLRADPLLGRLVDALRSQGFLADPDDRHVELAHETLLSHWPRLRQWCDRYRASLALRRQAKQAARDWLQAVEHDEALPASGQARRADALRWGWERQRPVLLALLDLGNRSAPVEPDFDDSGIDAWRVLESSLEKGLRRFLQPEPLTLLDELSGDETAHHRREEIGLRLNQMGDPRRGVGLAASGLPEIAWVDVTAGEVQLEGKGSQVFAVDALRIARYPVTWQQYNAFVNAEDGYRDRRWWRKLKQRKQPGEARWGFLNYPAINVCWSDAIAFCRWLNEQFGSHGPDVIRLPTEWEWQWVAQSGAARRKYPWSEEWNPARANSHESGVGRTMAVGMYPAGAPDGSLVADLAGNVWEWCLNEYHQPANTQIGGDQPRAMRGGSWLDYPGDLRAAKREYFAPDDRDGDIGFRIVLAPPLD
ncbi:SUMF1/EgtB/PvdO family nonheme iron enzyme [Accumulibacter sp.]|uniref:nSTAND1 domain-containing NTPase n=1 Tax=Accumulibacter sp. TaxID=2053492 RepID=UPI002631A8AD|nr:SUMF1/EgtB/PvdO family nonheme iron enzyme [Accumulibacter sp.]